MESKLEKYNSSFNQDDYFLIKKKYFDELLNSPFDVLEPSGYLEVTSKSLKELPKFEIPREKLAQYYNDAGNNIMEFKNPILKLWNSWDECIYNKDEITLCHSVTIAGFAVLEILKSIDIKTIFFETPAYYGTIYQAEMLKIKHIKIPTYKENNWKINLSKDQIRQNSPCAVWITQPKMSLGLNQNQKSIKQLAEIMGPNDFLVIDEATEKEFPSVLKNLNNSNYDCSIIKMRSFFKGCGLNGIRLTVVSHPIALKKKFNLAMWLFQGGLDLFSLTAGKIASISKDQFVLMLKLAREETIKKREKLENLSRGSIIEPIRLINGYIGTLRVNFPNNKFWENRRALLEYLKKEKIVATLGSSMFFAHDPCAEHIRLNYYLDEEVLIKTVQRLINFSPG